MGLLRGFVLLLICGSSGLTRAEDADAPSGDLDNLIGNEILSPAVSSGSCAAARMCCPGRDSACVIQKAAPNSIIEDLSDIPCYCDHACLTIGDCCTDFKTACGVQDCEVGKWGTWSACDQDCGLGAMTRSRPVTVEARHGGKACPALIQKRGCRGTRCPLHQARFNADDTAVLLPVEFNIRRKLNDSHDITRNLKLRYPKDPAKERSKPYCVEFEVIRSTRACKLLENFLGLSEGSRVCVMCEREAQRSYLDYRCSGTGSDNGASTRFSSLREPTCHGKWRHVQSDLECSCQAGAQYIFV